MANKYVAIIDAGSTSSRLFIYQWDTVREEERYTKPVKFKTILNGQGKAETRRGQGGIHTKVVDPDAVDIVCANANMQNYLAGILNEGVRVLGAAGVADANSVPLYVMATAGVRQKLDGADRGNAQQLAIMKCAWNAIGILRGTDGREVYKIGNDATSTAHSFAIKEALEGVYAWIAVNHGRYQPDQMPGILELGGKSMQIAFADPTIDISNDGVDDANGYFSRPVCLFKSRHKLRTRSWVLGSEESRVGAVEKQLIKTVLPNTPVFNPCLPHHETATIYNSNPPGGGAANRRESVGSGDFAKCLALAHSYIDNNLNANNQPLIPNNKPFPALDIEPFTKRFYGVSTFWYTWDFFSQSGHYDVHGAYDPKLFRQAVDEYCNGSWLQPFGWNEDGARDGNFINKHCFAAAWMMALLL
ncbi:hypothetical protein H0H92_008500 [Tricholoma furcatifolium]|nr:hypothetical protein H0H92_008500 [Tricholoma furcatifolium]